MVLCTVAQPPEFTLWDIPQQGQGPYCPRALWYTVATSMYQDPSLAKVVAGQSSTMQPIAGTPWISGHCVGNQKGRGFTSWVGSNGWQPLICLFSPNPPKTSLLTAAGGEEAGAGR